MGQAHQVAEYYLSVYPARSDVYSRWTPDGWRPLREPLTAEIVIAGLSGTGPSISGFMIAPPGQSHSLAIDFDREDGLALATLLGRKMWDEKMPAYVESSRRGAHLWSVLDQVVPAAVIRTALKGLMQAVGIPTDDPKIELRPGSDHIDPDGLGHALRLPMMPHPKTGQRWVLVDPRSGEPLGSRVSEVLMNMEWASSSALSGWSERYKPPPLTSLPKEYRNPHEPFPEDDSRASDILRELWGVENALPGRSVRCPAHQDKVASLSVLRDDRRVICKAPHCLLNNSDHGRGTYELRQMAPHG